MAVFINAIKKTQTIAPALYGTMHDATRTNGGSDVLTLPSGYASPSMVKCFGTTDNADPEHANFFNRYILNYGMDVSGTFLSDAVSTGSEFAKAREVVGGIYDPFMVSLPFREYMDIVPVNCGTSISPFYVPIRIMADGCDPIRHILSDDKTVARGKARSRGKVKSTWNVRNAKSNLQFRMYALAYYEKTGTIPTFYVNIVERSMDNLTVPIPKRKVRTIKLVHTKKALNETRVLVRRYAERVSEFLLSRKAPEEF